MGKHVVYRTVGTCSRSIEFDLADDGTVSHVRFEGGCNGNLKGICALCEGMHAQDLIDKLGGTKCGFKNTSCPDQLARAIREAQEEN